MGENGEYVVRVGCAYDASTCAGPRRRVRHISRRRMENAEREKVGERKEELGDLSTLAAFCSGRVPSSRELYLSRR